MPDYYIGLISGTSMDGIDTVLAEFGDRPFRMMATASRPYPPDLRAELMAATRQPAILHCRRAGQTRPLDR